MLIRALKESNYNISKTARVLNIGRNTVYNRMMRYGINKSNR